VKALTEELKPGAHLFKDVLVKDGWMDSYPQTKTKYALDLPSGNPTFATLCQRGWRYR
jgi:hypothetical protein